MFNKFLGQLNTFLEKKNEKYGNSALEPLHVFAKSGSAIEHRIDDKLSRIKNGYGLLKNDVIDLLGYLVLLCLREGWEIDTEDYE